MRKLKTVLDRGQNRSVTKKKVHVLIIVGKNGLNPRFLGIEFLFYRKFPILVIFFFSCS